MEGYCSGRKLLFYAISKAHADETPSHPKTARAIMSLVAVGYSRMMGLDESGTLETLKQ